MTQTQLQAQAALAAPLPPVPTAPPMGPRVARPRAHVVDPGPAANAYLQDTFQNDFSHLSIETRVDLQELGVEYDTAKETYARDRNLFWNATIPLDTKRLNGEDVTPEDKALLEDHRKDTEASLKAAKAKGEAVCTRLNLLHGQLGFTVRPACESIRGHLAALSLDLKDVCKRANNIGQTVDEIRQARDSSKSVLEKAKPRTFDGTLGNFLEFNDDQYNMVLRKNYPPAEAAAMVISSLRSPVKEAFVDFNKELGPHKVLEQVKRDWAPDAKLQRYYTAKIDEIYPLEAGASSKAIRKALNELKLNVLRYLQSNGLITGPPLARMVYDRLPRYVTEKLPGEREDYDEWAPLMQQAELLAAQKDAKELLPTRREANKDKQASGANGGTAAAANSGAIPKETKDKKNKNKRGKQGKDGEDGATETATAAAANAAGGKGGKGNSKKRKPNKPCDGCPACRNKAEKHNLSKCNAFANLDVNGRWAIIKEFAVCRSCLGQNCSGNNKCTRKKELCGGALKDGGSCKNNHNPMLHNPPKSD